MNRLFIILVCLFLASCSGEHGRDQENIPNHVRELENLTIFPRDTEPGYTIKLIPKQTFGDTGEPYLRNVMDIRVDDNGRVLIKEIISMTEQPIHVYNPDGSYRRQVGRIGGGPGEYGMVTTFSVSAGKLFLYNSLKRRLNIYDSETYTFERSVNLEDWSVFDHEAVQNMRLFMIYTRDDGNLIAHFYNGLNTTTDSVRQTFMLVNSDGDVLNPEPLLVIPDKYSILRGGKRVPQIVPDVIGGSSIFALSGDGTMYAGGPDGFLIKKFDSQGRHQSAFYYPVKAPPYDYESIFEGAGQPAPSSLRQQPSQTGTLEVPDTNPVLGYMTADDENRIWAIVRTEDPDTAEWWVLKNTGELLAQFTWPRNKPIQVIKDGHLYTKETDTTTEIQKVVRYRIEMKSIKKTKP